MGIAITYAITNLAVLGLFFYVTYRMTRTIEDFVVQAVESLFRIIDRGITDRENVKHIKEIKESLSALEGGRVLDI